MSLRPMSHKKNGLRKEFLSMRFGLDHQMIASLVGRY